MADTPFSSILKRFIKKSAKKQGALAAAVGVSEAAFSQWTRGITRPHEDNVRKIAAAVRTNEDLDSLFDDLMKAWRESAVPPRRKEERDKALSRAVTLFQRQSASFRQELLPILQDPKQSPLLAKALKDWELGRSGTRDLTAILNKIEPCNQNADSMRQVLRQSLQNESDQQFRDCLRGFCQRLDECLNQKRTIRTEDFKSLVKECFPLPTSPSFERVSEHLQGLLTSKFLHLLESAPPEIRRRWRISSDFVLNSILGYKTGSKGLDYLFHGGVLPSVGEGPLILIKGTYGTGKSTMALQIAASLAEQGYVSLYVSVEEKPAALMDRLSFLGYSSQGQPEPRGAKDAFSSRKVRRGSSQQELTVSWCESVSDARSPLPAAPIDDGAGHLVLLHHVPTAGYGTLADPLGPAIGSILQPIQDSGRFCSLMIDSLDALRGLDSREALEELFSHHRRPRTIVAFVSREASDAREFLVDITLELNALHRGPGLSERTVAITKCRTQGHLSGTHALELIPRYGVMVYPSIDSVLSVLRNRIATDQAGDSISWKVDEQLNLDDLVGGELKRGSLILAQGSPGSLKIPLALSFLASAPLDGTGQLCLYLSLTEREEQVFAVCDRYPQFKQAFAQAKGKERRLLVRARPHSEFVPVRLFHWIDNVVDEARKEAKGLKLTMTRAVLTGLGAFLSQIQNHPERALVVPGIEALFRKRNISLLLISPAPDPLAESADPAIAPQRQYLDGVMNIEIKKDEPGALVISALRMPFGARSCSLTVRQESDPGGFRLMVEKAEVVGPPLAEVQSA